MVSEQGITCVTLLLCKDMSEYEWRAKIYEWQGGIIMNGFIDFMGLFYMSFHYCLLGVIITVVQNKDYTGCKEILENNSWIKNMKLEG